MTPIQKYRVEQMRREYDAMKKNYLAYPGTSFSALHNPSNEQDLNVTIVQNSITEIDLNGQPFYELSVTLVEPDGNTMDMLKLLDNEDVNRYLKELKPV